MKRKEHRPVRVYVAGPSRELDRCRRAIEFVKVLSGVTVVDWPALIDSYGAASGAKVPERDRIRISRNALREAASAHVVWILAPHELVGTVGVWAEFGAAMLQRMTNEVAASGTLGADRPRIIASGEGTKLSEADFFLCGVDAIFESDDNAARWIHAECERLRGRV